MAARLLPLQLLTFSLLLYICYNSHNSLILLSHNASIYRHFMATFLLCCQHWWLPTPTLLQQRWLPTPLLLQQRWLPIVNGCCTLMATNLTITPFAIHVGQLSSCFFSTGLHLAALPSLPFWEHLWPSLQVLAKPFNHQSYQSTPFLIQKDHYNQMVSHITSEEC